MYRWGTKTLEKAKRKLKKEKQKKRNRKDWRILLLYYPWFPPMELVL